MSEKQASKQEKLNQTEVQGQVEADVESAEAPAAQTLQRKAMVLRLYFGNVHRNSRRKPPNSFGWRNAALIHTRKRPCAGDAHFATLC